MSIYGKGSKGKADKLFSKIIRAEGRCQKCGSQDFLQCAHIISSRYANTRVELDNAWALCAKCHRRLTDWPREHSRYITETIGSTRYEELREQAESISKVNWDDKYEQLKKLAKELDIKI